MSEELARSPVQRNLDAKFKIGGLEALDLIAALLFGAIMNLFFSGTPIGMVLVVVGPLLISGFLYFSKKGKPDNYLAHFIKFYLEPGALLAAKSPKTLEKKRSTIYES